MGNTEEIFWEAGLFPLFIRLTICMSHTLLEARADRIADLVAGFGHGFENSDRKRASTGAQTLAACTSTSLNATQHLGCIFLLLPLRRICPLPPQRSYTILLASRSVQGPFPSSR